MIWWLAACGPIYDPGDPAPQIPPDPPVITAFEVDCKRDADRWSISVDTDFWTGGGALWMTTGGDWFERHAIRSTRAAADGSTDHLELKLPIVADWRDASPGTTTAFSCADDAAWQLIVFNREGDPSDCRFEDPNGALATVPELPACEPASDDR